MAARPGAILTYRTGDGSTLQLRVHWTVNADPEEILARLNDLSERAYITVEEELKVQKQRIQSYEEQIAASQQRRMWTNE